jgi:hypothetical protein
MHREETFVAENDAAAADYKEPTYTHTYTHTHREETFVTENDAAAADYKDATTGKPLQKMTEESYFFR